VRCWVCPGVLCPSSLTYTSAPAANFTPAFGGYSPANGAANSQGALSRARVELAAGEQLRRLIADRWANRSNTPSSGFGSGEWLDAAYECGGPGFAHCRGHILGWQQPHCH
jgi:hypothetical protein